MKEVTIEQKAKRYDEALAGAKHYYEELDSDTTKNVLEEIFSELKESEDEKIMKELIGFLKEEEAKADITSKHSKTLCKYIVWLEKQGEHANFRNKIQIGDKVTRNDTNNIEYTHTDAFIDKAAEYLSYHLDTSKIDVNYKFEFIEDFKKYMEE